ncbi:hypothetical protein McPS_05530 [Marichromatium sp. PS1]
MDEAKAPFPSGETLPGQIQLTGIDVQTDRMGAGVVLQQGQALPAGKRRRRCGQGRRIAA